MKKVILTLALSFSFLFSFGNELSPNEISLKTSYSNAEIFTNTNNCLENYDSGLTTFEDDFYGSCTITLEGYNQDGELVYYNRFTVHAYSEFHCAQLANVFRRFVSGDL